MGDHSEIEWLLLRRLVFSGWVLDVAMKFDYSLIPRLPAQQHGEERSLIPRPDLWHSKTCSNLIVKHSFYCQHWYFLCSDLANFLGLECPPDHKSKDEGFVTKWKPPSLANDWWFTSDWMFHLCHTQRTAASMQLVELLTQHRDQLLGGHQPHAYPSTLVSSDSPPW